jgi:hypothetical protein
MNARRLALVLALVVAGCAPAAAAPTKPIVLAGGADGLVNLASGPYRFDWKTTCTSFFLEWAPTTRSTAAIRIPVADPLTGSATIAVTAGPAYINRGGFCPNDGDYTVTITPAT